MAAAHTHTDIEINFLLRGEVKYLAAYGYETLKAGCGFVFWGGLPHKNVACSSDSMGIWITLPISWLVQQDISNACKESLFKGQFLHFGSRSNDALLEFQFEQWLCDFNSHTYENHCIVMLELEAFIRRLSIKYNKEQIKDTQIKANSHTKILEVAQYLSEHYQKDISLEMLANQVGVHPKYLSQTFKKTYGSSLWTYLTQLRIAHAQHLLAMTQMSILDICYASGFNSTAPFYQAFAKYCGNKKPLQFRAQIRRG